MSIPTTAAYGRTYPPHTGGPINVEKTGIAAATTMAQFMVAAEAKAAEAPDTPATGTDQPQSLEDFKKEFYAFIDSVPVHHSQAEARRAVIIHDKAFEKMMNDPEFKTHVEELIRREFSGDFGHAKPSWTSMVFDENGVYSGSAGGDASMGRYETLANTAFWRNDSDTAWSQPTLRSKSSEKAQKKTKERAKREQMDALLERLAEKRKLQARQLQENYDVKFAQNGEKVRTGYLHESLPPISNFDVPL